MAESEALKKRHEEELSKQKEELERLLKLHEEEKKAQEKLIAVRPEKHKNEGWRSISSCSHKL